MIGRKILNKIYYRHFKGDKYLVLGTTTSIRGKYKNTRYIGYGLHTEEDKSYYIYKVSNNKYLALDPYSRPLQGPHVVYQNQDGQIYLRPYRMFIEELDQDKYPNINKDYRFEIDTEGDE